MLFALGCAALDADQARGLFGDVHARVAPLGAGRADRRCLVRFHPHQGEYFVLLTILTGIKTMGPQPVPSAACSLWRRLGFSTSWLMRKVECMPANVLPAERRKRTWFNAASVRAKVESTHVPERRLWRRLRRGYHVPNPALRLRVHDADGQGT